MLVRNENFQEIDLNDVLSSILSEFNEEQTIDVSEDEAQKALAEMYVESNLIANQHYFKNADYMMPVAQAEAQKAGFINQLWNDFRTWLCPKFDENTEQEKIAELVAEFLANLLMAKVIIKRLLKILIFYVLKYGNSKMCKNVTS